MAKEIEAHYRLQVRRRLMDLEATCDGLRKEVAELKNRNRQVEEMLTRILENVRYQTEKVEEMTRKIATLANVICKSAAVQGPEAKEGDDDK